MSQVLPRDREPDSDGARSRNRGNPTRQLHFAPSTSETKSPPLPKVEPTSLDSTLAYSSSDRDKEVSPAAENGSTLPRRVFLPYARWQRDDRGEESIRDHPLYKNVQVHADGLFHCPWEGQPTCSHKPQRLKCNYDICIDSHIKPYICSFESCKNRRFSSTNSLRRHERELHSKQGILRDNPFPCPFSECPRHLPGNGFITVSSLKNHLRGIHWVEYVSDPASFAPTDNVTAFATNTQDNSKQADTDVLQTRTSTTPAPGNKGGIESTYTDSGYVSASRVEPAAGSLLLDTETAGYHGQFHVHKTATVSDEIETTYSLETTAVPDLIQQSIFNVCKDISARLEPHVHSKNLEILSNAIPGLIKAFAVQLGTGLEDEFGLPTMYFVHKHHREISIQLQQMISPKLEPASQGHSKSDNMSLHDKMVLWGRNSDIDERRAIDSELFEGVDDGEEWERHHDIDPDPREYSIYSKVIINSEAYKWLIASCLKESSLELGCSRGTAAVHQIRSNILSKFPKTIISRKNPPKIKRMAFRLPPLAPTFNVDTDRNGKASVSVWQLPDIVVLTCSSKDRVQATSFWQYIRQTWPYGGAEFADLLRDAVSKPSYIPRRLYLQDKTEIGIVWKDSHILVWVSGLAQAVAERAEQLAWLAATLERSPSTASFVFSTPKITAHERADTSVTTSPHWNNWDVSLQKDAFEADGELPPLYKATWLQPLFTQSPAIIQGFPVPLRPDHCPGIEMSAGTLFETVQSPLLQYVGDRTVLIGERATVELVGIASGLHIWHALGASRECSCRHIFADSIGSYLRSVHSLRLSDLSGYRHIVGDCESTRASYDSEESLTRLGPHRTAFNNFSKEGTNESLPGGSKSSVPTDTLAALVIDANSPEASFDSSLLSMSDTSRDADVRPSLEAEDPWFSIIDSVVRYLLLEYRDQSCQVSGDWLCTVDAGPMGNGNSPSQGHGGSQPSSNTRNSAIALNHSPTRQYPQRKRPTQDDSDADDDGDARRKRQAQQHVGGDKKCSKLLACPFWKLDPDKHRDCFHKKLLRISRVKQHLLRTHAPPWYCEFCLAILPSKEEHRRHVQGTGRDCSYHACDFDGITHDQKRRLSAKSKHSHSQSEQWFVIWDILFPGRPRPTSPYMDPGLSEDLCHFREHIQAHGPRILARELRARTSAAGSEVSEEEINRHMESVIAHGLNSMIDEWVARRDSMRQLNGSPNSQSLGPSVQEETPSAPSDPPLQYSPLSLFADSGIVVGSQQLSSNISQLDALGGSETYQLNHRPTGLAQPLGTALSQVDVTHLFSTVDGALPYTFEDSPAWLEQSPDFQGLGASFFHDDELEAAAFLSGTRWA